jgi:glyoxylase-like metal-dependent hydrolase (beta-lactamase superfamily II)
MREILPSIHTWPWYSERFHYDFNGYLVEHAGGNLVIDPVEMTPAVEDELARRGVARILLTNRNHFRDAAKLRQRTGARVAVHPADAAFVRDKGVTVDDELHEGQVVGPLRVVGVPGKSPGEVALHWPERGILFVGDACVGNPPGECGLLPEKVMDSPEELRSSLRRLAQTVDFEVLLVGDGAPVLTGGRASLGRLVSSWPSHE